MSEADWISVGTEVPKIGYAVLVYQANGTFPTIGWRRNSYKGRFRWSINGVISTSVTHWMPLPAPPAPYGGMNR